MGQGRACVLTHSVLCFSALQEVRIPPGPRLLILNHVDRYRSALKPPMFPPRQPPPQAAPHASPAQKH